MKQNMVLHPSGKRVFIGSTQAKPQASFVRSIASKTGIAETSAREVLTQGKIRKGWQVVTMQRKRLPMVLTYHLTQAGKERLASNPVVESAFSAFLLFCDGQEAGDVSEKMLAKGYDKHTRERVTIDGARAAKLGLVKIIRQSNEI